MDFFEKYNLSPGKIVKVFAVGILGLAVIFIAFGFINSILSSVSSNRQYSSPPFSQKSISSNFMSDGLMMNEGAGEIMPSLRNIAPDNNYIAGADAEDFEITEYRANIETRKLEKSCETIMNLKEKNYVVFERSNSGDNNCNFRFKVKKDNVEEILAVVKSLKPKDLNENIQSIKKQLDDFTSEEEILKRKLETMEATLSSAIISYDQISRLATQTRDANSLASIIESKIKIIERLSQEKINTSARLERIGRMKGEQLDKLEYTYFNINIYENKYVDVDQLRNSWKSSIKNFVVEMNGVFQDLSIGLIILIAYTFQYLLYLLIIVVTAKYVWKFFKRLWRR